MYTCEVDQAGQQVGKMVRESKAQPIFLTEDGVPVAVMVSPEEWEAMVEDSYDLDHVLSRNDEQEEKTPLREVLSRLGMEDLMAHEGGCI